MGTLEIRKDHLIHLISHTINRGNTKTTRGTNKFSRFQASELFLLIQGCINSLLWPCLILAMECLLRCLLASRTLHKTCIICKTCIHLLTVENNLKNPLPQTSMSCFNQCLKNLKKNWRTQILRKNLLKLPAITTKTLQILSAKCSVTIKSLKTILISRKDK